MLAEVPFPVLQMAGKDASEETAVMVLPKKVYVSAMKDPSELCTDSSNEFVFETVPVPELRQAADVQFTSPMSPIDFASPLVQQKQDVLPILYEVVRVINGRPMFLDEHIARMRRGVDITLGYQSSMPTMIFLPGWLII